jgi:hypothetical protein
MADDDNTLYPDESLVIGESISSDNEKYTMTMQGDGNLVLYRTNDWLPLWASGTDGHAVSQAIMQGDGNFVVYGYNPPLWASNTDGHPGSYLTVQDDGNAVIYNPLYDPAEPIWSTNTWMF